MRGYRDALTWIHQDAQRIPVSNEAILRLHAMTRGQIWDAGLYKEIDGDIIERYPDGRERVRFRTVPAKETPAAMARLVGDWQACLEERWVPPLIALAAFNLKSAYREFVERVGETSEPRGSKTRMVLEAIAKMPGTFSLAGLERACPGVSRDMIRRVLNTQKGQSVDCIGRGPGALWQRRGN